jgi:hypothetical protein
MVIRPTWGEFLHSATFLRYRPVVTLTALLAMASGLLSQTQQPRSAALKQPVQVEYRDGRLEFKIDSAAFALAHDAVGGVVYPTSGNKLLLLRYTLRNLGRNEMSLTPSSLAMALVTPSASVPVFRQDSTPMAALKPGQGVQRQLWVEVRDDETKPAIDVRVAGQMFRYRLDSGIEPLKGPFAAEGGLVALAEVVAKPTQPVRTYGVEISLDGPVSTVSEVGSFPPSRDERYAVVPVAIRNHGKAALLARRAVGVRVEDAEGTAIHSVTAILNARENTRAADEIRPGGTDRVRFIFRVPATYRVASVILLDEHLNRRIRIPL